MKLPEGKIELAISKEQARYTLNAVYLNVEEKHLVATDGHILALVPVEVDEGDVTGNISQETIVEARKIFKKRENRNLQATILCSDKERAQIVTGNGTLSYPRPDQQYPNYHAVTRDALAKTEGKVVTVGLNANLLQKLALALGPENRNGEAIISLTIVDAETAVVVRNTANPEALGIIMPCGV